MQATGGVENSTGDKISCKEKTSVFFFFLEVLLVTRTAVFNLSVQGVVLGKFDQPVARCSF